MRNIRWQIALGISLIVLSAVVYLIHYLVFRDSYHIFIYLIGDIAFVFIQVLLVTLVIDRVLNMRQKRDRLQKLNMLIGVYFSEMGTQLLAYFSDSDPHLDEIKKDLIVKTGWTNEEFKQVGQKLRKYDYTIDVSKINLPSLRLFLQDKSDFILRIIENPNLLEHESFTELLRAVLHLYEELMNRKDVSHLSEPDHQHIKGDIKRAYGHLVLEWLDYMFYLKKAYPYLFSLAIRMNPFDETATIEIQAL